MESIEALQAELAELVKPREGFQEEFNALREVANDLIMRDHPASWLYLQWVAAQSMIGPAGDQNLPAAFNLMDHLLGIARTMVAAGFQDADRFYAAIVELRTTSISIAEKAAHLASITNELSSLSAGSATRH